MACTALSGHMEHVTMRCVRTHMQVRTHMCIVASVCACDFPQTRAIRLNNKPATQTPSPHPPSITKHSPGNDRRYPHRWPACRPPCPCPRHPTGRPAQRSPSMRTDWAPVGWRPGRCHCWRFAACWRSCCWFGLWRAFERERGGDAGIGPDAVPERGETHARVNWKGDGGVGAICYEDIQPARVCVEQKIIWRVFGYRTHTHGLARRRRLRRSSSPSTTRSSSDDLSVSTRELQLSALLKVFV